MESIVENGSWIAGFWEWLKAMGPYLWSFSAWALLVASAFMGFVGVFVPVIPGAIVFFLGGLAHKLMLPDTFSWWVIGVLGILMVLDRVVDLVATAFGTKWFGGTKWGIFGALAGGLVGLFFGIVGILIGPIIGAVVFEIVWARRHPKEAAKSGVGAGIGFGISAIGRMAVYFMMIGALGVDLGIDDVDVDEESVEAVLGGEY